VFKVVLEFVIAFTLIGLLVQLVRQRRLLLPHHRGFDIMLVGLALVTFAALLDASELQSFFADQTTLSRVILVVELLFGYLSGIILIGVGLGFWVPAMISHQSEAAARLEAERRLGRETELVRRLLDNAPGVFYMFDESRRLVRWNRQLEDLLGYTSNELQGLPFEKLLDPLDHDVARTMVNQLTHEGSTAGRISIVGRDGDKIPVFATGAMVKLDGGRCAVGLALDISARLTTEALLRRSNLELDARSASLRTLTALSDRLHGTLEVEEIARQAVQVILRFGRPKMVAFYLLSEDEKHLRLVADEGFTESTRRQGMELPVEGSLSGLAVTSQRLMLCTDIANDRRLEPKVRQALQDQGAQFVASVPLVFRGQAFGALNAVSYERSQVDLMFLDTLRAIGQTVSLALANARHLMGLEYQAYHDSLTGLANRSQLHRRFPEIAEASDDGTERRLALILFDLDHFKEVNDALGHRVGDILLRSIGARMEQTVGSRNSLVCRLGGDEFAVLMGGVSTAAEAETIALKVLFETSRPVEVDGMSLQVGASAGIAVAPIHGRDSHELLRCADVAMYRAKGTTARVAVYAPEDDQHTPERLALMGDLGRAIDDGDLILLFQPKIALDDGRLVGFEALIRWRHPRLGLLAPDEFIPLAELGDVIHPLTAWVTDAAVDQLRHWLGVRPELTLAINLSTRNLLDLQCAAMIEQTVERYEVDPARLEIELTETALLKDPDLAGATLDRLDDLGVRLAIDDFGTGYSSLSLLQRFRIDTLKIDRSFVANIDRDETSTAIVRSVIGLAHGLGLDVVAEGVEQQATCDALRALGADLGQGFLFGRPAPAADFAQLIDSGRWIG